MVGHDRETIFQAEVVDERVGCWGLVMSGMGVLVLAVFGSIFIFGEGDGSSLPPCEAVLGRFEIPFRNCRWDVEVDKGADIVKIRLIGDETIIGRNDLEIIDVSEIPDFAAAPKTIGWSGDIEIDDRYRNRGLGEVMWRIGDENLKREYGSVTRIYINASVENFAFGFKIKRLVTVEFETGEYREDFIYTIR